MVLNINFIIYIVPVGDLNKESFAKSRPKRTREENRREVLKSLQGKALTFGIIPNWNFKHPHSILRQIYEKVTYTLQGPD